MSTRPKTAKKQNVVDQRLVKAIGHPIRTQALAILNERVASPNELAKELGEPLGVVSYHVRILLDLGALELVRTEPRRGAVEHYYRAVMRPFFDQDDWNAMPKSMRQSISAATLRLIWQDVERATKSGTFDARDDRHLSRTPLVVDEQGWGELCELLTDAFERALDIEAESASRLADSGGEGVATKLEIMYFASSGPDDDGAPAASAKPRRKRAAGGRRKSR
jgi:DNA-binding transcriptional ArsR family regulator